MKKVTYGQIRTRLTAAVPRCTRL